MNVPGLGPDSDRTVFPVSPRSQDRLSRMSRWLEFNSREVAVEMDSGDVRDLIHVAEAARALVREFFATPGPVPAEMGQLYLAVRALEDD